jgi:hypothetical protein
VQHGRGDHGHDAHLPAHLTAAALVAGAVQRRDARRLERIEQTVDATAIEVERLGESNRFVAKLLADKTDALRP